MQSTVLFFSIMLLGCQDKELDSQSLHKTIRGLKAMTIGEPSKEVFRHYSSVLRASESSTLSFEISGKLGQNKLNVGQRISKNDILLELDRTTLQLSVNQATAALEQARASLSNIKSDYKRQLNLFKKKIITQAIIDKIKTDQTVAKSQVKLLASQLETSKEQLSKSSLIAPYDGIITSVNNNSYINVQAGEAIATIYNPNSFELQILVPYDVLQYLFVDKRVSITLADNPSLILSAHISELASSTDVASSYPVIILINEVISELKVGMSVEASIGLEVATGDGFIIPLASIITGGKFEQGESALSPVNAEIFLYNPKTKSVNKKIIRIAGIKDNNIIVIAGLHKGDIVATAGVSFLTDGQKVKLLISKK